jgi:hypothetical protein
LHLNMGFVNMNTSIDETQSTKRSLKLNALMVELVDTTDLFNIVNVNLSTTEKCTSSQ